MAWIYILLTLFIMEIRLPCVGTDSEVVKEGNQICFETVGCFSINFPFISEPDRPHAVLPDSPDVIQTKFRLYTRDSIETPEVVDARYLNETPYIWSKFKVRPTKILVHGFLDTLNLTNWWKNLIFELLKHGDFNVVFVDWANGNVITYAQSTANTRVVGAQIAELVKYLTTYTTLTAAEVHIIGHSLGAHVAGYAGEKIPGLGRITGLDPAGPYFEGTHKLVRLDETDALFVDAIHTDGKDLEQLGLGTMTQSGHMDFFPNMGRSQPGCTKSPAWSVIEYGFNEGIVTSLICSHARAIRYFTESISSTCPFKAFPCDSEENFANHRCQSCGSLGCANMGYHADRKRPPEGQFVKYYLTIGDSEPFCRFHVIVTIKFSPGNWPQVTGTYNLLVNGDLFTRNTLTLTGSYSPQTISPGQSNTFYVDLPYDFGNVQNLTFTWRLEPSLRFNRNKFIYLDQVDVTRQESEAVYSFCVDGQRVESGVPLTTANKCST